MAGPYAGMMLADLGADVIKIETAKGDPFRRYGRPETPYSAVFANCNRSKRSVVLDLKDPAGRDALLEILADADVFLANWRCRHRRVARADRRRARGHQPAARALLRHRVRPRRSARRRARVRHRPPGAQRPHRRHHRARPRPEPHPRLPRRQAGRDDGRAGDPRVAVRARPDRDRRPDRGADARRLRPTSTSPTCSPTASSSTTSRTSPGTCR